MIATPLYIGCAGWSLARADRPRFADQGSHLERYASVFSAVEINSSFYRPHQRATYQRWSDSVPENFRFAAKLPRTITHDRRLIGALPLLDTFLGEVGALGEKLGALLVQLPPSLAFDARSAVAFFRAFRRRYDRGLCVEPRHASWFEAPAESAMRRYRVARVAADPALNAAAALPGGDPSLRYTRLHGSPRMYYSAYDQAYLRATAQRLQAERVGGAATWCIFDNTAAGHAVPNALELLGMLSRYVQTAPQ
ncbi:DUF72 domain-containing protein [Tahibacter sp.]|uniref:DUF72 domain-containing protein n=1 Tax=Tahibacter sp. TaxID=2056211 RepID=UPI0028C3DFF8|nr:DUF72 domain-containing protein [Tahibacter sp.]